MMPPPAVGGPPLLGVHVLFHPASTRARELALELFRLLNGQSTDWGPRIPVHFGATDEFGRPARLPDPEGGRSLVVVLVDERMVRRATADDRRTAEAWAELLDDLLTRYPPGRSGACSVLPVAVDEGAFTLSEALDGRSFVRLDAYEQRHLEFHVVIGCLRLMQGRPASEPDDVQALPEAKVEIFVSHAKRDLPKKAWRGAVAALLAAHRSLPLEPWYDSSDIPVGAEFAQEIDRAVRRASAVIVVLTDNYSSREWCRREMLAAKSAGRPIVVVDAIESRVVRLFPYIGNAPMVRWRAALTDAIRPGYESAPSAERETWEVEDASTVLLVTLVEALRHQHESARLRAWAGPSDVVLGTHPELITVTAAPAKAAQMVYPDPPLGREELEWVRTARPHLELLTPLGSLARWTAPTDHPLVALSLSGSADTDRYGGTELHLSTMAHDLALYLLFGGYRLLYGGVLGHGAVGRDGYAPGDDVNYVERLMELVERYSPLAREAGRTLHPIQNWLAWPLHEELAEKERNLYRGNRAELTEVAPPPDLTDLIHELPPGSGRPSADDTPTWRYIRSRCLTAMRERATREASARVALGGKLESYVGILPGVVEEILITLRSGKPLYLLGAFGGAARLVVDVLEGASREELTSDWCEDRVPGWRELLDQHRHRGDSLTTPEQAADELRSRGAAGLAACLANGLTDHQNRELTTVSDSRRAVELLLHGLHATWTSQR